MDKLLNQEIMNTAFINDEYCNLKRKRELLKINKKRTPKKIGNLEKRKEVKSPTARKLNGIFKTMTKQSSPVKGVNSSEHNFEDSLIDYSLWIQNLKEDISKFENYEHLCDTKLDETMEIEGLDELMKKICTIAK